MRKGGTDGRVKRREKRRFASVHRYPDTIKDLPAIANRKKKKVVRETER